MNGVRWYTPSEVRWCTPSEASNTLRAGRVTRFERGEQFAPSRASDILRAGRATSFEQGERHPSSKASDILRAGRTVKLGFTDIIRFAVRFKFSLRENLVKNIEGGDTAPSSKADSETWFYSYNSVCCPLQVFLAGKLAEKYRRMRYCTFGKRMLPALMGVNGSL